VDPIEVVRAEAMLTGYHCRWIHEDYEVLAIEEAFSAPLVHPDTGIASRAFRLGGKVDGVVRDGRTGRVLLVEHKTSSEDLSPGSDYWKRLRIDSQISVYWAGVRALGFEVTGCLYDVLGKPGLLPLKATPEESRKYRKDGAIYANQREADETPEEYRARLVDELAAHPGKYFQRSEVVRFDHELRDAAIDTWETARAIHADGFGGQSQRNPDACLKYGRPCSFWGACTGEASLDDPRHFIRDTVIHPELAG
jgi:hypothetical protein